MYISMNRTLYTYIFFAKTVKISFNFNKIMAEPPKFVGFLFIQYKGKNVVYKKFK